jgi:hypothetical protein
MCSLKVILLKISSEILEQSRLEISRLAGSNLEAIISTLEKVMRRDPDAPLVEIVLLLRQIQLCVGRPQGLIRTKRYFFFLSKLLL